MPEPDTREMGRLLQGRQPEKSVLHDYIPTFPGVDDTKSGVFGKAWFGNSSLAAPEAKERADATSWPQAIRNTRAALHPLVGAAKMLDGALTSGRDFLASDPFRNPQEAGPAAFGVAANTVMGGLPVKRPTNSIGMSGNSEKPPIRAYHGSPHDFDKFDISKIGTGEGAQAFGHGLYFAENEGVAKSYRTGLAGPMGPTIDTLLESQSGSFKAAAEQARKYEAMAKAGKMPAGPMGDPQHWVDVSRQLGTGKRPGNMYEVGIKADPDHFLDWDKPLSGQSERVRSAINGGLPQEFGVKGQSGHDHQLYDFGKQPRGGSPFRTSDRALAERIALEHGGELVASTPKIPSKNGKEIYGSDIVRSTGAQGNNGFLTEQQLQAAGIPGIKYFDQGSRTTGAGSRNYVVFDPSIIEIMRKYGIVPGMMGGAAALGGGQEPEQAQYKKMLAEGGT
jgi:hypothetical protein